MVFIFTDLTYNMNLDFKFHVKNILIFLFENYYKFFLTFITETYDLY